MQEYRLCPKCALNYVQSDGLCATCKGEEMARWEKENHGDGRVLNPTKGTV